MGTWRFRFVILLSLASAHASASEFLSKGVDCANCDPLKGARVYVGWTDFETLCDAVPAGVIAVTGRADPVQFEFQETDRNFQLLDEGLSRAAEDPEIGAETRAISRDALARLRQLRQDVIPGLQAYDCAGSDVSKEERVAKVIAAMDKVRQSEAFFKNFLIRAKAVGTRLENASSETPWKTIPWISEVIIPAHGLSCRLYFAKVTVDFTVARGMNPVTARACAVAREVKKSAPASSGVNAEEANDSDITGI